MNNRDFQNVANDFLNNPNGNNMGKIKNLMNSREGAQLAMELNRMSKTNPNIQNVVNSAKLGDMNSAINSLKGMLNTQEGQNIAKTLSKILGE